ncbi:hypothetical protein SAY87_012923 [Trapa incisa]|uniref:Dof zinc finger protein n=2 Tax=Trapa TaxID=22665 RepID=A0AAN7KEU7_TRANT|nr:hypothetical protein SAY86_008886 [Trapa natans]KAK4763485.1 hypothetical protein SAY87_012923 [Trapa incisa]
MDAADHQEMMRSDPQSLESILMGPTKSQLQEAAAAKKQRPQHEQALECPRCESTNTKFCYYNNYSLSQPRYFCKSCRRYWTKGGTLRNVPVGGGCRKTKRSSSSSSKRISISATSQDHQDHHQNPHQQQLQDLIALHSNGGPLIALNSLAYEASNPGESSHLPVPFAHQLHRIADGQFMNMTGYDFPMHEVFHEAPGMDANLHGMYFGLGEVNTSGAVSGESMMHPYEEMKPDVCSGENRALWGCQWPLHNGDGFCNNNLGDLSSAGVSWNNIGLSSSFHNLINSPLLM